VPASWATQHATMRLDALLRPYQLDYDLATVYQMHYISLTTDQLEIFQNSLIEHTQKAAFLALDLSIKRSIPFPNNLKTD